jgi:Phage integrase family
MLGDATGWDKLVAERGLPGLVRHGLRHTALTWMANAGVELHLLQRVAGHQDPAVTARYLHPDVEAMIAAGTAFSTWWSGNSAAPSLGVVDDNRTGVSVRQMTGSPASGGHLRLVNESELVRIWSVVAMSRA